MKKCNYSNFSYSAIYVAIASLCVSSGAFATNDGFFQDGVTPVSEQAAEARTRESDANRARITAMPKTPAMKTQTGYSESLRCMDELFLANGKKDIIITSAGIPDATGKAKAGDKEMLTNALASMSVKSKAFRFMDMPTFAQGGMGESDIGTVIDQWRDAGKRVPDFYIRGSVTQFDDNAIRESKGGSGGFWFFDASYGKDKSLDLMTMDMSVVDAASRYIIPETSVSNSFLITKENRSGELGGQIFTLGLSFSKDISRSEGVGATYRTLMQLNLIQSLGRFTQVPYWKCLDIESTHPTLMNQVREWYDASSDEDRLIFIQRKLAGMSRYQGSLDGQMSDDLKKAIMDYQVFTGLIPDGRVNFDLYFSMKDDIQNKLATLPSESMKKNKNIQPTEPLRINLINEYGDSTYKIGDTLKARLSINQQGTVYCFYEDSGGNISKIFPNRFHRDSMLNKNQIISLASNGFKIKFDKAGTERIACIASDRVLSAPLGLNEVQDLEVFSAKLQLKSIDQVVDKFKNMNPSLVSSVIYLQVK